MTWVVIPAISAVKSDTRHPTPRAETPEALGTPVRMDSHQVEVMPPHTNTGVTVAGRS